MIPINKSKNGLTFDIMLTPHASQNEIAGYQDGALKVKVTALPVEGAANEACLKLLAKKLGLKKNQLEIFVGSKSRKKVVLVKNIKQEELEKKIYLLK
jgi:uncharacterized protein